MNTVRSYSARIYVGFKEGYTGPVHTLDEARAICQRYVDEVGLCVTLTPTEFIYTRGNEPGCIVGLIHYPRFPTTPETIKVLACEIGQLLKDAFGQQRVTIEYPDETEMLE